MGKPVFIEPIVNKDVADCTISCLVMWTGKSYQDVLEAAPSQAHKRGMYNREVIETAAKLGTALVARRRYDVSEDDGILMLAPRPPNKQAHAVVLLNGLVLDPYNGRLWLDVGVYLTTEHYKAGQLLVEEES